MAQAFLARAASTDGVAVVSLVTEQGCSLRHHLQQSLGFLTIVDLSAGQSALGGMTVSVNKGMDLAREAASGTPDAAIIGSPFLPIAPFQWTSTQVGSIMTILASKAAETAASSLSHTPALRQRANRLKEAVEGPLPSGAVRPTVSLSETAREPHSARNGHQPRERCAAYGTAVAR